MNRSLFVIFICLFSLFDSSVKGQGAAKSNETDLAALVEFRSRVSNDPDKVFSSWNDTVDFCRWMGITCGRRHARVTKLELPGSRLGGSLSPFIGNISFLSILNLRNNSFAGEIPSEIGKLRRLTFLGFTNNSFSGNIPENITGCTNLRHLLLGYNKLVGEIPRGIAALLKLQNLRIYKNSLTGNIPEFFGNLSSIEFISGVYNDFTGVVPASLGQLHNLKGLYFGVNNLFGTLPFSIFNITSLVDMDFPANQLEGSLPSDLGDTLPLLERLNFATNHLIGPIPTSIANATNLLIIGLSNNNFSGSVPDLKNLNRLQWLGIGFNHLGSGAQGDLKFVESLNATDLRELVFCGNSFGGVLPRSIGNLSSKLTRMAIGLNQLTGTVPSSIGNLRNLEALDIQSNQFTGSLPEEVGHLHKLKGFVGVYNGFTGEIPSSFGNLTMLTKLSLAGNSFEGSIPASLGNCRNLLRLELSINNLSGTIPSQVLSISSLAYVLDLAQNKLTGALPSEIGDLNNLAILYVDNNRLSGRVPNTLSRCTILEQLYMGNNLFEGNISSFLSPLKGLRYLDLSQNKFSGEIPKFLSNFNLTYLNLSSNHFEGKVPKLGVFLNATGISVMGNDKLCGGISELNLPICPTSTSKSIGKVSSKVIISTVSGTVILVVVLSSLVLCICTKRERRRNVKPKSGLVQVGPFPQISYEDILRATEGLNQNCLIGAGNFGSVYKGILGNGDHKVAIKVLDLSTRAAGKSFMAECEALRNIRHRNLVKISTACSTTDFQGNDFKALVYEYMENGSLEDLLHSNVSAEGMIQKLSLLQRLSIAIDVVCAVEYLHQEIETPIIHCDLKPSNVLLDADMTAHVGDFGLARILSTDEVVLQVSSVGVKGTIGYSPPEYGIGSKVSREGDVYSYGILLLEMFTGKRPTNEMFGEAWNIRRYCEAALPDRVTEIADPSLFSNELGEGPSSRAPRRMQECLEMVFEVGIECSQEAPRERMDIHDAAAKLCAIKASAR